MDRSAELTALRAENTRLIKLLERHGIEWQQPPRITDSVSIESNTSSFSTQDKIALFRKLFRGREDVFPIQWESKSTGKTGYSPACANEWRPGVCKKPQIKCSDCDNKSFVPLSDNAIYDHLIGLQTLGVYPLHSDNSCQLLAVDFDEAEWKADVLAFAHSCDELAVPVAVEVSRSGKGAHAWVFFTSSVPATDARRLGTAILSHTCAKSRQLKLSSYDRLFPNQDTMPKGGLGNLIALPLQKYPRENGCSVFVDAELQPYSDQWKFLASIHLMDPADIDTTILRATNGVHPLDISFINDEDLDAPWKQKQILSNQLTGKLPELVKLVSANMLFIEKEPLPQLLTNRLIRLAAFQNPEFYKAQKMRLSTWDKPRVIGCAENYPKHIALPRGCLDDVLDLLSSNNIKFEMIDERIVGENIDVRFRGTLRLDQEAALAGMLLHDTGVLCAPTAFGKTVTAAALIARRGVSTLILVHRAELLRQWQERLLMFLDLDDGHVGSIGAGKNRPTGKIDIALIQTISRRENPDSLLQNYGQVIVDECHHLAAVSFEKVLKLSKAKYVLGLTATPVRRDGKHPIIFMQCGPVRYAAASPAGAPQDLQVLQRKNSSLIEVSADARIQDVFRHIVNDTDRTLAIANEIKDAFSQGRKLLVLTERADHLQAIQTLVQDELPSLFVLHGRVPKKQRSAVIKQLEAMPPEAPRVVLATGKLVGEGFDHPPLDTLILSMPISWKGTLQQYAGRLHREHLHKKTVRIIDFVDTGHPALVRMWERRRRGYRAMGYRVMSDEGISTEEARRAVLKSR